MSGQSLSEIKTPAEIAAIAAKGYKNSAATRLLEKLEKSNNPETSKAYLSRLKNLTGPRTLEGRIKSLSNLTAGNKLNSSSDSDITLLDDDDPLRELLLNDAEVNVYRSKKLKYESEFKLNESSDQLVLEQILLEEINLFRLRKNQRDYNVKLAQGKSGKNLFNPNRQITECIKNLKILVEKLAVDRKQRTGGKDSIGDDVATLSQVYEKEYTDQKYEDADVAKKMDEQEEAEIEKFMKESEDNKLAELKKMGLM